MNPRRVAAAAVLALAAAGLAGLVSSSGAAADDPLYRAASFDRGAAKVRVSPEHYSAVTIDVGAVRAALATAPAAGKSTSTTAFAVPTPTGGTERFAVQRTQVMQSGLAAAHPEIGTWVGHSLDHSGTTIALDVTPMGFHASVRGPNGQGAWYVDPAYNVAGTTTHLSYYGAAVDTTDQQQFVERETPAIRRSVAEKSAQAAQGGRSVTQRVYRLALTSDPSYAAYFGSANVLAEKATLINRVNQVYNDDLAISLQLINGSDVLNLDTAAKATGANGPCGAHACFDPADPSDPDSYSQLDFCDVPTLGRNRTVLGQLVGASAYDIGHIALGVNGGGVAFLGVVGGDFKGGGCTGVPQPQGDLYAIDYVAHEMGHQFGAGHTFNGAQANCSGGNRVRRSSVEPGSGSSVMAYAGICLQDDLQPHSDPYFSQRSITEIGDYASEKADAVTEVQTVSLRGFDTNGEQITLSFPGVAGTQTLTRGTTYNAAGIKAAVEALTGKQVTVAQWGFDPLSTQTRRLATPTAPDDTGFQVIFAATVSPYKYGGAGDVASLGVTSGSPGVSGFVGETAKGGDPDNRGAATTTDNHAPRVVAPKLRTVPARTPFRLSGRASDRDGDKLSYLWEQNDRGGLHGTALVDNHKVFGPLFRVFGTAARVTSKGTLTSPSPGENTATRNGTRYFPDLAQVLANNTNARTGLCPPVPPLPNDLDDYKPVERRAVECYSEFLPTSDYRGTGRSGPRMHFRLTVRDNRPTGGGVGHDDVVLKVDRDAGPFLVTSQDRRPSYASGGSGVVTWQVNGTRVLSPHVRILLSTNGGRTWSSVVARTANDGSARVHFPSAHTGNARIMVEAAENYFFAVNPEPFRIG